MSGRVLIFDSDTVRLGRLVQAVTQAGGEPFEAASAAAAVRAAAGCDLVLLAGEEGLSALSAISAAHPSLPRISIVGPVGAADAERLVDAIRGALVHHRPAAADFEALTRDRLTGALGWHYFRLRLGEELDRAGRYTRALSLLLVDLDDLRGLNDRLGRAAGDFALASVASALITGARSVDFVGRWAGGAFGLLLPETAVGAAYGLAERLRADLGCPPAARAAAALAPEPPAAGDDELRRRVSI